MVTIPCHGWWSTRHLQKICGGNQCIQLLVFPWGDGMTTLGRWNMLTHTQYQWMLGWINPAEWEKDHDNGDDDDDDDHDDDDGDDDDHDDDDSDFKCLTSVVCWANVCYVLCCLFIWLLWLWISFILIHFSYNNGRNVVSSKKCDPGACGARRSCEEGACK